jgi:hypothetical protein
MKLKALLLFLFLFSSIQIYAQDIALKDKFISFGISPTSLIEPKTSTLESVFEVRPINNFSIELKYGFPAGITLRRVNDRLYDYHEIKAGLRYWRYGDMLFAGLEYFHVNHRYDKSNDFFTENGSNIFYEKAVVLRKVNGVRLRAGISYSFNFGLTLEYFSGVGVRNVAISYPSVTNSQQIADTSFLEDGLFGSVDREIGSKNKFDLYSGIKVSWRLRRW